MKKITTILTFLCLITFASAGTLFVGLEGSAPPTFSSDLNGFPNVTWDPHYSFDVSGAAATPEGILYIIEGAFTTHLYETTLTKFAELQGKTLNESATTGTVDLENILSSNDFTDAKLVVEWYKYGSDSPIQRLTCDAVTVTGALLSDTITLDGLVGLETFDFNWGSLASVSWTNVDPSQALQLDNISVSTTVVPVPAAVWLFGSGLLGLVGVARRAPRALPRIV